MSSKITGAILRTGFSERYNKVLVVRNVHSHFDFKVMFVSPNPAVGPERCFDAANVPEVVVEEFHVFRIGSRKSKAIWPQSIHLCAEEGRERFMSDLPAG